MGAIPLIWCIAGRECNKTGFAGGVANMKTEHGHQLAAVLPVLDVLEVPQRQRTAETYRRLAKLVADWVDGCTGPRF